MSMALLPPAPPTEPGQIHEAQPDDREPKTRRKLMFWDRAKLTVVLLAWLGLSIAVKHGDIPVMSWGDAVRDQLQAKQYVLWLIAFEVLRQFHFFHSERRPGYHGFWSDHVWGAWDRRMSKLDPWLRYRLGRVVKVLGWGALVMLLFSNLWGVTFFEAIVQAPSRLWSNPFGSGGLPWFVNVIMMLALSVGQFVAIFWFMSKGGIDTYMPNEVKTRFTDVWGQDRVLDKVKENIVFLDKPEEIEGKGGHVPSGILLWGPPGTGKTLMAQAVAGETGRPYVFVDPGAFNAMFFGVGILKVKGLFRKLRKLALRHGGVIVFFDEADTLGNRGIGAGGFKVANAEEHHAIIGAQCCNHLSYVGQSTASSIYQESLLALRDTRAEAALPRSARRGILNVVNPVMGGGGGMGTLQALLTELSGLEKPRGMVHRRLRVFLSMDPKKPPKYRILTMFATNLPQALDEALLRPGRIDRMYKVDFPTLDGRVRTFQGYFKKVRHQLTDEQVERLAIMSPSASGATIKDIVNESLIVAMRNGRDAITWPDVLEAKAFKVHGMPDGVAPTELEQFETAIHEAGHAVASYLLRRRDVIDIATIEQRGSVGGFVSWVPVEERKFDWRSNWEDDIVVMLCSLAAERMVFGGDNSNGVGGDLASATMLVRRMLGHVAMGDTIASYGGFDQMNSAPQGLNFLHKKIEDKLQELFERAKQLLTENRWFMVSIAHALQAHRTISGEDIDAIYKGTTGPTVDGGMYHTEAFRNAYEAYVEHAFGAHRDQGRITDPLPRFSRVTATYAHQQTTGYQNGNGYPNANGYPNGNGYPNNGNGYPNGNGHSNGNGANGGYGLPPVVAPPVVTPAPMPPVSAPAPPAPVPPVAPAPDNGWAPPSAAPASSPLMPPASEQPPSIS